MTNTIRRACVGVIALASALTMPLMCLAAGEGESAKAVSVSVWEHLLKPCGDGFVYAPREDGLTIVKLSGIRFSNSAAQLSDADRQAGIEWQGYFSLRARFYKIFVPSSVPISSATPPRGEWGIWRENIGKLPLITYALRKSHGRWEVALSDGAHGFTPVTSNDIPVWRLSCSDRDDPNLLPQ